MSDYPIRFQDDEMFFEGSPMDALPVALAQIKLMQDRIAELEAEVSDVSYCQNCADTERHLKEIQAESLTWNGRIDNAVNAFCEAAAERDAARKRIAYLENQLSCGEPTCEGRIAELEAENERLKRSCGRVERDLMAALKVQLDLASERDRARAALEDSA